MHNANRQRAEEQSNQGSQPNQMKTAAEIYPRENVKRN